MSAWSTSVICTGPRSAATRPAKPRPTGMRTPLLDLLLQPLRGPGGQRAAVLLQQQDRDGVHRQDVAHALEQLVQQLAQGKRREGGVGDPLEITQLRRAVTGHLGGERT